ncbi:MAG: subtilase family serine protease [Rhodobacteraceae bacterium HLUCCA12]|nr:MAG: subtilase family serine protease [Rhodobacteraceae bacterium HLUCCA12]
MRRPFTSRLRGALGVAVLALATGLSTPSFAQDLLSSTAMARMPDASAITSALEESENGRVSVIVEFEAPDLAGLAAQSASSTAETAAEADAALTAAVHSAQNSILGRVMDQDDAEGLNAALSDRSIGLVRMNFTPMFAISADASMLESLAADPDVVRIHHNGADEPYLRSSLPVIGMPDAYDAGATGEDWRVAVLDTGGRRSHEFLNRQIVSAACYSNSGGAGGMTSLCPGGVPSSINIDSANDCDRGTIFGCGHGTHVAGTAAGFNLNPNGVNPDFGVARDARIISINVFTQFPRSQCGSIPSQYTGGCVLAYTSDQISGLERVYALRNSMDIAAVNMSLGGGVHFSHCDTDSRKSIIDQLRSAGIATVIAAGNNGATYIGAPACISSSVSVASSTNSDIRSSFSNWNSLLDVVAPGSDINASIVNGTSNNSYALLSGTSMATPHVTGAFAALRSAVPSASVSDIEEALEATGTPISSGSVSLPRINVDLALARLRGGGGLNPTTSAVTGPATSTEGTSVTFTATVSATAGGTPSGTVTFRNNGTAMGTRTLSSGTASFSTASLPVGTNQISVVYSGSATHAASTSPNFAHTVTGTNGAHPVNDDFADRSPMSGPGRYTGSNVGATNETGEPTHAGRTSADNSVWWRYTPSSSGEVTIDTDGSDFDTVLAVYTGSAVNALSEVASNDDAIGLQSRVVFNATAGTSYAIAVAGYGGADGDIVLNVVGGGGGGGPTPTTTSLSGPSSSVFGQSVTFNTTVSADSGIPAGSVTFRRGTTTLGSASLSAGATDLTTSSLPVGSHQITAEYNGSATHAGSTSSPRSHTVSQADVTVWLWSDRHDDTYRPGERAELTARVNVDSPGGGTPTGTVRFTANGNTLGSASLSGATATLSTELPLGTNTVVAEYQGTTGYRAGDSSPLTVIVSAGLGDEVIVNQRTALIQQRPAISPLRRSAVVVFEDQHVNNGPFGVTAQRVNWRGDRNGSPITVARPAEGTGYPAVAELVQNAWVVVWQAQGRGGRPDIFMRRFRVNGRAMDRQPRTVNDSGRGQQTVPRVAALEDGGYVVVWQSSRADGNGEGIVMRIFEASGNPRTGDIVVNETTQGDQVGPDVTVQEGGDIVVTWAGPTNRGNGAFSRRVDAQGNMVDGETVVGQAGRASVPHVRTAALDNGNFAVAFEASDRLRRDGPYSVVVQRNRRLGGPWGDPERMERLRSGDQLLPAISGLRRMSLVTVWNAPDGNQGGIWGQTIGRDGDPIGAPEMINTTTQGDQRQPAVGTVGDTRHFFVVWTTPDSGTSDNTNIALRRFMGP